MIRKRNYIFCLLCFLPCPCFRHVPRRKEEKEPVKEEREAVVEEEEKEPEPEPEEPIPANQNLLTGIPDLTDAPIGKRPVAVMVNNIPKAMPQYGIEKADIIFEIPVEGDQTRFMALDADYTTMTQICPIRSCRYYFPALSQGPTFSSIGNR